MNIRKSIIVILVTGLLTGVVVLTHQNAMQQEKLEQLRADGTAYQVAIRALNRQTLYEYRRNNELWDRLVTSRPGSPNTPPAAEFPGSNDSPIPNGSTVPEEPVTPEEAERLYARANTILVYNLEPTSQGQPVENFDNYPDGTIREAAIIAYRLRDDGYADLSSVLLSELDECVDVARAIDMEVVWQLESLITENEGEQVPPPN